MFEGIPETRELYIAEVSNYAGHVESAVFGAYQERARRHPIASYEEQLELGYQIQAANAARLAVAKDLPRDPAEIDIVIEQGNKAHTELVLSNLLFAVYKAKNFMGQGVPLDDLVQHANIALMRAAWLWRPDNETNAKFQSYARQAIKNELLWLIHEHKQHIHVPEHVRAQLRAIDELQDEQYAQYGTYLNDEEIRDYGAYGSSTWQGIVAARVALQDITLLDADSLSVATEEYDGEDHGVHQPRQRPDNNTYDIEQHFSYNELREELEAALETLNDRYAEVIRLRYGFTDGTPKTHDEIAIIFGVAKSRIGQIESKALARLRQNRHLREYLSSF